MSSVENFTQSAKTSVNEWKIIQVNIIKDKLKFINVNDWKRGQTIQDQWINHLFILSFFCHVYMFIKIKK